ncbi:site-specific DNA recombinase [Butyrivibrio proteoclasticus]|uniref:Site-specific DNA recombinase n=1 Tax=Butyrivibrio proteoclasticus TaxID=43305 RepID=A0A1I5TMU4_9FIRM|nr:recombinase family protein [Butyrivibrio proteoclasticus]SFP84379.1 site-specific DNA recombinase [Butyrivibrio proteoclasticus]
MKTKKTKCYIYTRVSTAMQVDGYSLDAQKEKLKRYADYEEMEIVGEYSDEGHSGKNINGRPEFVRMLQDIEDCKDDVSYVLVFKLSRFGRNAADVLNSLQLMQDFGVNLICVEDGINSAKESGKLMISILSAVAELERENILVQTMEGRRQKAREGKWNGGFAPYGYKLVDGSLVIAEDEAEMIRLIFDKYIHTDMGANGVAEYLNNHGHKKKQRQNNTLTTFAPSFIKGVLDNPVYMGKLAYGRRATEKIQGTRNEFHVVKQDEFPIYEGEHDAIISEEDFMLAKEKRERTGFKHEKTHSLEHEHILSGILKCPVCGGSMYANVNRKKRSDGSYYKDFFYYACKHRIKLDGHHCDYHRQWGQDKENAAVEETVKKMVNNPKFKAALKAKIGANVDASELKAERESYRKSLQQCIGAKNKLAAQIDALDVTDNYYDRKYQDMQERLDALYDQMGDIEEKIETVNKRIENLLQERLSADTIYKVLIQFDKLYDNFTDLEKKKFMQSFIEEVQIYEQPKENGRFLKSISFAFPVYYNDKEFTTIAFGEDALKEYADNLTKENLVGWDKEITDETVVLLTKTSASEG